MSHFVSWQLIGYFTNNKKFSLVELKETEELSSITTEAEQCLWNLFLDKTYTDIERLKTQACVYTLVRAHLHIYIYTSTTHANTIRCTYIDCYSVCAPRITSFRRGRGGEESWEEWVARCVYWGVYLCLYVCKHVPASSSSVQEYLCIQECTYKLENFRKYYWSWHAVCVGVCVCARSPHAFGQPNERVHECVCVCLCLCLCVVCFCFGTGGFEQQWLSPVACTRRSRRIDLQNS